MAKNKPNNDIDSLVDQAMLAYKLMMDSDVPSYLKLIPLAVAAYVLSPIDLLPEALLGPLGLLDDPFAVFLGIKAFINLAPDDLVRRHRDGETGDVVEGEFVDPKDVKDQIKYQ